MAQILVTEVRARRLSAAGDLISGAPQPDVGTRPDCRLFPLFCVLFFSIVRPVPAPAAFLSPLQGLAL